MCQHECFEDCTADVQDGNTLMLPKLTPSHMDVRLEGEFFFWLVSLQWAGHLVFSISCSPRLSLTLSLPGQPWECSYGCTRLVVITWKEKRDVNMYRNILLGEIVGNKRTCLLRSPKKVVQVRFEFLFSDTKTRTSDSLCPC